MRSAATRNGLSSSRVNVHYGEEATQLVIGSYARFVERAEVSGVLMGPEVLDRFSRVVNVERQFSNIFKALADIVLHYCHEPHRKVVIDQDDNGRTVVMLVLR